jgi:hypothetical protein
MGLKIICCGMIVKRVGILGVSVRKMKALTKKMEAVTLIGKGRYNLTYLMYYMYEINTKIFFLSMCFIFGGVILDLDKYLFSWQFFLFV